MRHLILSACVCALVGVDGGLSKQTIKGSHRERFWFSLSSVVLLTPKDSVNINSYKCVTFVSISILYK